MKKTILILSLMISAVAALSQMKTAVSSVNKTVDAFARPVRHYLRNVDKRIQYMVYTNAGAFRAVALFPGNYELTVRARGLISISANIITSGLTMPFARRSKARTRASNSGTENGLTM